MKRLFFSVASILTISLAAAITAGTQPMPAGAEPGSRYEVQIDNFSFNPATLTIPAGATVTWTNHDDVPHNVVSSEGKKFKSPVLDTDQKFSFTFSEAGSYQYFCGLHPKMIGKVVVQ